MDKTKQVMRWAHKTARGIAGDRAGSSAPPVQTKHAFIIWRWLPNVYAERNSASKVGPNKAPMTAFKSGPVRW